METGKLLDSGFTGMSPRGTSCRPRKYVESLRVSWGYDADTVVPHCSQWTDPGPLFGRVVKEVVGEYQGLRARRTSSEVSRIEGLETGESTTPVDTGTIRTKTSRVEMV